MASFLPGLIYRLLPDAGTASTGLARNDAKMIDVLPAAILESVGGIYDRRRLQSCVDSHYHGKSCSQWIAE